MSLHPYKIMGYTVYLYFNFIKTIKIRRADVIPFAKITGKLFIFTP
ncbi:hypothetical protein [Maribacter stanieri]|nr:hypothetical protein [Maribacter stanieri]